MSTKVTKSKASESAAKSTKTTKTTRSKKDPNAPKRPQTAFILYMSDNRQRIKDQNPGIAFTDVPKIGAQEWKTAKAVTKNKYQALADKERVRYEREKEHYVPDESFKKLKRKKDPNAPKRPLTVYMLFANARQSVIKKQHPEFTQQQVIKRVGEDWRNLTEKDKVVYQKQHEKEQARYQSEKEKYEAQKTK